LVVGNKIIMVLFFIFSKSYKLYKYFFKQHHINRAIIIEANTPPMAPPIAPAMAPFLGD
jgi:hypothetical protein